MGKIQKLPEELIRLIAAGEVIERPASVLKEVVENSLDAGATQVSIDIWGAGRTRIRVSDDGSGMSREDAVQALDRHATSKLHAFEDLQNLTSFGFRGEALPSIAAVSRLELTTRDAGADKGWRLKADGGKIISTTSVGVPVGTTVDVQDLFFNTPARAKFLKRDSTERSHMLRTVQELALAHPGVGFEVNVEGRGAMSLAPAASLRSRLNDLWDATLTDQLVAFEFAHGPTSVQGVINALPAHQPTKSYQHLFANNRPIQQRLLTHAIYEAYHEWLPVGRHPAFMLFLSVDPSVVDINVHPAKREVRFSNERVLYDLLFHQIRNLLQRRQDVPAVQMPGGSAQPSFVSDSIRSNYQTAGSAPNLSAGAVAVAELPLTEIQPAQSKRLDGNIRILGQFQKVYVLAEQGEDLLLIDQHAAAERVLYEKLLGLSKLNALKTQPLLTPHVWELPPDRAEIVRDAQPVLTSLGFRIESFGGNSFAVKEWPAIFPQLRQAQRFLDVFIESLEEESHDPHEHAMHEAVARAACRAAIKANDTLALAEMQHLIQELSACERPMTCPHGRPTHVRLSRAELHHRFGRT